MKYFFIAKPPLQKQFLEEFETFKKEFDCEIHLTEKFGKNNAQNLAREALQKGYKRVVVVGGDGTIFETINGLLKESKEKLPPDFAFGIIPGGSGNNFARGLGISKNPSEAFEIIKRDKKKLVDLGKVNEMYFANCFSLGFDAKINDLANRLKTNLENLPRNLTYFFAALFEISRGIFSFEAEIEIFNFKFKSEKALIAITNSDSYGGIFKINPSAVMDDGKLNCCLIDRVGRFKSFYELFLVIRGNHLKELEVHNFLISSSLRIKTDKPVVFEADGEVFPPLNYFEIKPLPRIINVLVS